MYGNDTPRRVRVGTLSCVTAFTAVAEKPRRVRVGALTRNQLAALVRVLTPYSQEPITAPVVELAAKLARFESAQASTEVVQ